MKTELVITKRLNWQENGLLPAPETKIVLNGIDLSDKILVYDLSQDTRGAILNISIIIDEINGEPPALRKDRGE